jgi:hypothetical protein
VTSAAAVLFAALSGVAVTPAGTPTVPSTSITFSANQTLPAGYQFTFASQPTVVYTLAAPGVTAGTAGTLTKAYNGPAGPTTATGMADANWPSEGTIFTFSANQTLPVGFQFQVNGVGTVYTLTTAMVATESLPQSSFTPVFTPVAGAYTITSALSGGTQVVTLPAVAANDSSPVAVLRIATENGEATQIEATPWANLLAQAGAKVLTSQGGIFTCVGADRQPITLTSVPASALVL